MALRKGRGVSAVNYPTGMNLGGDPTQALVHSTPTGNFMVSLSSVDLGQGMKQVMTQICAETIGDFALEVQMDKLARLIGMDPLEFRFINAYRDGDMKAHRQPTEGAALVECMQEAARISNWPISEKYFAMSSIRREG
jgi:CO/xanthine dehydrogenase Mo-binding subunit